MYSLWKRRPMVAHCRHRFSKTTVLVPLALILVLFTAAVGGKQHIVGGSIWSIPPSKNFYNNWSSSQTFHPGDVLYFDFESQMYDVVQLRYGQYARCEWDYVKNIYSDGPALVTLTSEGELYFTCGFFNYCSLGLKMTVDVTPPPPPPPQP